MMFYPPCCGVVPDQRCLDTIKIAAIYHRQPLLKSNTKRKTNPIFLFVCHTKY